MTAIAEKRKSKGPEALPFEAFLECLREETDVLENLLKNFELQREALIKNDLQGFVKNLEEQQILVWETDNREKLRKELIAKIYPEQPPDEVSFNEILAAAPASLKPALEEERRLMRNLVNKINLYRDTNRRLINKSLEILNYRIKLLTQWSERFYNQNGETEKQVPKLIDRQV